MAGGAFGLAIAFAATRALIVFVAEGATYTALDPLPDTAVLLFTIGVSLLAGLLFGLARPSMRLVLLLVPCSAPIRELFRAAAVRAAGWHRRHWSSHKSCFRSCFLSEQVCFCVHFAICRVRITGLSKVAC
jgi:hypothetical protein